MVRSAPEGGRCGRVARCAPVAHCMLVLQLGKRLLLLLLHVCHVIPAGRWGSCVLADSAPTAGRPSWRI